jgi:glutathione synthase
VPENRALKDFAAVLMRKDPPFDMEYVYSTYLLEAAEREGARVFNRPRAIRDHNEKFAIAQFGEFIAPTLVTRDAARIDAFIDAQGDTIVKPLDGMGGTSVFRVRADDPNRNVIVETVGQHGARTVMAQRSSRRSPTATSACCSSPASRCRSRWRASRRRARRAAISPCGGRGVARPLTLRDRQIAAALGPPLWAEGLLVVGLDVIGDSLTEVNVTSPTCFVEISQQSGFDVGAMFAAALEKATA